MLFWVIFWGNGGIYQKSYNAVLLCPISCFIVQNFKFITLTLFFTTHLEGGFGRLGRVIKKQFNSVLSAHRLRVYAESFESVALMVSEKRCLNIA